MSAIRRVALSGVAGMALALTAGCVSGRWSRVVEGRELSGPALAAELTPGQADLSQCLAALGAPNYVEEQGAGMVLSWGWFRSTAWGFTASLPTRFGSSASFRFDNLDGRTRGLVLFFDADLVLERIEHGFLAELRPTLLQRRPQIVE